MVITEDIKRVCEILGIDPNTPDDEVDKAYLAMMAEWHTSSDNLTKEKLLELTNVYQRVAFHRDHRIKNDRSSEQSDAIHTKKEERSTMSSPSQQTMTPPHAIESPAIKKVASGQKLFIYAILVNFLSVGLQAAFGAIAGLVAIIAAVLSVIGVFRLASGFGYSVGIKVLLIFLMLIPFINMITLLMLHSRATKALRAAGFKVGLLGARL